METKGDIKEEVVLEISSQHKSNLTIEKKKVQKLLEHEDVYYDCPWSRIIKRMTDKQYRFMWAMVLDGKRVIIK